MSGSVSTVSVMPGVSSSSLIVRVTGSGLATPWPPLAVAATSMAASGASTALSLAVTVTAPVLAVWPAAMVSLALPLSVAGAFAGRLTVIVVSALEARSRVAVTVLTLPAPLSSIVVGDRLSVATGRASSSVSVISSPLTATVSPALPETVMDSLPSDTASCFGVSVKVSEALACPPGMVILKSACVS